MTERINIVSGSIFAVGQRGQGMTSTIPNQSLYDANKSL